ncbi:hypothetical protein D3C86_2055300 [compost metagenome]
MHVHKAGGDEAPAQVFHRHARERTDQRPVVAHGLHHMPATGVRSRHQQPVGIVDRGVVVGKTEDGGAVGFHGP